MVEHRFEPRPPKSHYSIHYKYLRSKILKWSAVTDVDLELYLQINPTVWLMAPVPAGGHYWSSGFSEKQSKSEESGKSIKVPSLLISGCYPTTKSIGLPMCVLLKVARRQAIASFPDCY